LQEIENEYRTLRFSTRVNRGNVDVDGESTLSDALQWMVSATETNAEEQRYADYLEDGGTESIHSYMLDFHNLRPSISNMRRPVYKEWYRTHIYQPWCQGRRLGSGFTTDLDLDDLISLWLSHRQPPRSWANSNPPSPPDQQTSSDTSITEPDSEPWYPVPPNLVASMTPPSSPSNTSAASHNRYSPLADNTETNPDPEPVPGWAEIVKAEHIAVDGFRTAVFEVVCILLLFRIVFCC